MSVGIQKSFNHERINIVFDDQNVPWFNATELARLLKVSNIRKALSDYVDPDDQLAVETIETTLGTLKFPNQSRRAGFINSHGVYALMTNIPDLDETFKIWFHSELLPSVSSTPEQYQDQLKKIIVQQDKQLNQKETDVRHYCDAIQHLVSSSNRPVPQQQHHIILIKTTETANYPYYMIDAPQRRIGQQVKRLFEAFPNMIIKLHLVYSDQPVYSATALANEFKSLIDSELPMVTRYHHFFKSQYETEEDLFRAMRQLYELVYEMANA